MSRIWWDTFQCLKHRIVIDTGHDIWTGPPKIMVSSWDLKKFLDRLKLGDVCVGNPEEEITITIPKWSTSHTRTNDIFLLVMKAISMQRAIVWVLLLLPFNQPSVACWLLERGESIAIHIETHFEREYRVQKSKNNHFLRRKLHPINISPRTWWYQRLKWWKIKLRTCKLNLKRFDATYICERTESWWNWQCWSFGFAETYSWCWKYLSSWELAAGSAVKMCECAR